VTVLHLFVPVKRKARPDIAESMLPSCARSFINILCYSADVSTVITDAVLEVLSMSGKQLERMVMVYAGLVAALHNVIGMEVGM
jgi:hypothetical protein